MGGVLKSGTERVTADGASGVEGEVKDNGVSGEMKNEGCGVWSVRVGVLCEVVVDEVVVRAGVL